MHNFYTDENFTVNIQWVKDVPCMHVDVTHYSPSVHKKMVKVWDDVQSWLRSEGYTYVGSLIKDDPTIVKFNEKFGMKCIYNDGKYRTMVKDL